MGVNQILLPEYGRNVQKMVRFLSTIDDRAVRNRQAEVVVGIMGNLYPYKRDTDEFRHMLWDHLFMIAGFDLDVDSPYPQPTREQFSPMPERIDYPHGGILQKQYGHYAPTILKTLADDAQVSTDDPTIVVSNLTKFMRQKSYDYSGDYPDNQTVIEDVSRYTDGCFAQDTSTFEGVQLVQNHKAPISKKKNYNRRKKN